MAEPTKDSAPAPQPGTPEHDAAMIAKVDATMGTPPAAEPAPKVERPAHIPEKFWDAEKGEVRLDDVLKAHGELEKKLGEQKPAANPPATDQQPAAPSQEQAQQAVQKAGLDMAALNAEFAEKGDLTPETRAKLEQAGYPKEMVDSYIAGQKAIGEAYQRKAEEAAGGSEQLKSVLDWGTKNMSPAEAKAYNDAVTSGDEARMQLAVAGLRARYEAAEGVKPTLVNGEAGAAVAEAFATQADMTKAMRDPRYRTDAAYRKSVEQKVLNSKFM